MTRNQYIDILRFVGAFCILKTHFLPTLHLPLPFGRIGIDLFFVISGFLIGQILIKHRINIEEQRYNKTSALADFYSRRALRIFPLYYGVILFFVFIQYSPVTAKIGWHLTYTSNYGQILGENMANFSHFWTLCVEEQFYFLMPLIVLCTPIKHLPKILIGIFSFALSFKIILAYSADSIITITRGLYSNMEGLLIGVLMGYINILGTRRSYKMLLTSLTIIGVFFFVILQWARFFYYDNVAVADLPFYTAFCDLTIALMFAYPILLCSGLRHSEGITVKLFAYLGQISYGIYVYHFIMIPFMPAWFSSIGLKISSVNEGISSFILCSLLAIIVSIISWHLYERPILNLKNRIRILHYHN